MLARSSMGFLKQINARIPAPLYSVLSERAKLAGKTPAGYLRSIVEYWESQGCPPVTLYESKLLGGGQSRESRGSPGR